ncbi:MULTISPECIES: hypothetical protein [unclassified Amycolatopsis]|uniref:hypothetical protein n=1 Tax=unclassified Amycolatopsis TaxID=2618356 RepID=UPI002874BFD9|nr:MULTISPECIES: hypothetical protein [unclassified Amycolatopsis]MDS0133677.1 hypothetical protein [Amycolatopsis sp. 505]MDS0148478.1 hypothetical protein [Amycolatopsis sp. CM201R]
MAPNHSDQPAATDPGSLVPLGDNSASQNIVDNARGSAGGFDMGSDRAIANPPNWNAQESQQLYAGAVNNNDPGTAEATGHVWAHHGSELKQASDHLYNAISELGNAWVGRGAAGAQGALVAIANSGSQASDAAHTMSDRLAKQAAAAAEVKKMPAPKDYDPKQAMAAALAGGPAALIADQKAQADAANDVKAQQVAFFNAYTQAMKEVDNSTPSFGPESLGMKPTASHNSLSFNSVNSVGSTGSVGSLPGAGDAIFASGGAGFGGHGAAFGAQHAGVVGPNGVHGGVAGAGFGADAATLGSDGAGGSVSGAGTGTGAGHVPAGSGQPGGSNPLGKVGLGLGIGGVAGGLGALASRALGAGSKSGAKSKDDTSLAAADGQGQSAASAQAPQQGLVSSAGTIGGQTPPPMNPGMGGMAPQGAQGEQDEEHTHASFLIEADPDEAFGANQATPPPVIGWSGDDEDR